MERKDGNNGIKPSFPPHTALGLKHIVSKAFKPSLRYPYGDKMPLDLKDLEGVPKIDDKVQLPAEWKLKGFIETKDGSKCLVFARPNEPDIRLFANRMDKRNGVWFCAEQHIANQDKRAAEYALKRT